MKYWDVFPAGLVKKKSKKGKTSRMEYFECAIDSSNLVLFKNVNDSSWRRLGFDLETMEKTMSNNSSELLLGTRAFHK